MNCPVHGGDGKNLLAWDDPQSGHILFSCSTAGCPSQEIHQWFLDNDAEYSRCFGRDGIPQKEAAPVRAAKQKVSTNGSSAYTAPPGKIVNEKSGKSGEWFYRTANGKPDVRVQRFDPPGEKKRFTQSHFTGGKEVFKKKPGLQPLYRWDVIHASTRYLLIVEGEKAADAAANRFTDYDVTTWPGGSSTVLEADWERIAGRTVILWPDNDKPGHKAMRECALRLMELNCSVNLVDTSCLPDGGDLANPEPPGMSYATMIEAARAIESADDLPDLVDWPELTPLTQEIAPEPFPMDAIEHPRFRDFIEKIADESEVPVDLVATQAFATVAATIQSHARYEVTHTEMPCIYAVGLAASGDRKSSVERRLSAPLHTMFKEAYRDYKADVANNADESEVCQKRIKSLKNMAGRETDPKKRSALLSQAKELQSELPEIDPPVPLVASEATGAGIKKAMMRPGSNETLFFSNSEGRLVEILFGGAYEAEADTDIIQQAYSGDSCNGLRARDESVQGVLNRPTLSIGLIVQPGMLQSFFKAESSVYKGSIARFLWCWPESKAGTRTFHGRRCPDYLLDWWDQLLRDLWEHKAPKDQYGERGWFELGVEPDAIKAWRQFILSIEPERNPRTGRFAMEGEAMASWANKIEGHAIRLAIALHAIWHGSAYTEHPVSTRAMEKAIKLVKYYMAHARRVFRATTTDGQTRDAVKCLNMIRRIVQDNPGTKSVAMTDLLNRGFNNMDAARRKQAIAVLQNNGYLIQQTEAAGKGRPKQVLLINPAYIADLLSKLSKLSKGTPQEIEPEELLDEPGF